MDKKRRIILTILSLIGLGLSIELIHVYMSANFDPISFPSFCSVNNFIDCDGVAKTPYAVFLGIPLAVWGVFLYCLFLFLTYADKIQNKVKCPCISAFKNPRSYIATIGLISFTVSMILAGISIFKIQKICYLCFLTYIIDGIIALTAMTLGNKFFHDIKVTTLDFIEALKNKVNLILFIIAAILATGVLYYTNSSLIFAPQVKRMKAIQYFITLTGNPYNANGNTLGNINGDIVIETFTDFQCGFCKVENYIIQKVVTQFKNVRVEHNNIPLDKSCNKNLFYQVHDGSCLLAKYVIAAGMQEKYWDMDTAIFDKIPRTEKDLLKIGEELGLDTKKLKKDANGKQVEDILQKQIAKAIKNKVEATPTIIIKSKEQQELSVGLKPDYEIEETIIKFGGIKK